MSAIDIAAKLVREFEGCSLRAYLDVNGYSIGWGCHHNVTEGMMIDQAEADRRLQEDLESTLTKIKVQITAPLNDNQLAALISFTYNEGAEHLRQSTVESCIESHNYADAASAFLLWDKSRGVAVPGLLRRREAEKTLFLS